MEKVRDARIDTLKGVLILSVVFGHFFTHDASDSLASEILSNFIYSFHMPLFVFVSGYFSNNRNVVKGGVRLLETYVVFQLIKGFWYHYSALWLLIMPGPMLWYLIALIVWRFISVGLEKIGLKVSWFFLSMLVVLSVAVGFIPWVGREFALSRIIVFLPYFFLGVHLRNIQIIDEVRERVSFKFALIILTITLIAGALFAFHSIDVKSVFSGTYPYPSKNKWLYAMARFFSYFSSVVIAVSIVRICSFENKTLGIIGKDSLKYYMFHGVLLMIVEYLGLPWSTLFAILYASIVSLAIFVFNKTHLSDIVVSPISYWIQSRKVCT